jgi:hypothetical protein
MIRDERRLIHLTDRSAYVLKRALATAHIPDDQGLRLVADGTGAFMTVVGSPCEGDAMIHCLGRPILLAAPEVASSLRGGVLDIVPPDNGRSATALPRLSLRSRAPG